MVFHHTAAIILFGTANPVPNTYTIRSDIYSIFRSWVADHTLLRGTLVHLARYMISNFKTLGRRKYLASCHVRGGAWLGGEEKLEPMASYVVWWQRWGVGWKEKSTCEAFWGVEISICRWKRRAPIPVRSVASRSGVAGCKVWRILQELGRVGVLLHLEVRRSKGTIVRPRSLMSYALCPEYVRLFFGVLPDCNDLATGSWGVSWMMCAVQKGIMSSYGWTPCWLMRSGGDRSYRLKT